VFYLAAFAFFARTKLAMAALVQFGGSKSANARLYEWMHDEQNQDAGKKSDENEPFYADLWVTPL